MLRDRRLKQDEHELDQFVRRVLEIERRQLGSMKTNQGTTRKTAKATRRSYPIETRGFGEFNAHP